MMGLILTILLALPLHTAPIPPDIPTDRIDRRSDKALALHDPEDVNVVRRRSAQIVGLIRAAENDLRSEMPAWEPTSCTTEGVTCARQ